jgi:SAM-dependent methyltransferase
MDGYRPDTYGEAFADVYDDWYGEVSDASGTARFVDRLAPPGPVLELGVGSGRLAGPLAELGRPVVGLDASGSMLARCRRSWPAVRAVRGDMVAVPLRGPFAAVLCAFNTVFNLASDSDQRRAVSEAARVLSPGGALIVEAITGEELASGPRSSVGVTRMTTDRLVLTATLLDADAQLLEGQHVELSAAGVRLRPWRLRWMTPDQLDAVAAEAGLGLEQRYGDWDASAYGPGCDRHVSVYRPG